ncbi:MAG: hypothetical protein IJL98_08035 [Lachnospiraceae bacterium]|nr:hypothetical protein [Lachnospiraceae bacterium]
MKQLYHKEDLEKLKKEYKTGWWAAGILMALALAACIYLAVSAKTLTFRQHETAAILVFLLTGWLCLTGYYAFLDPIRRQTVHFENMLEKEPETLEGRVTLLKTWVRIPKSITVRDVLLEHEDGTAKRIRLNRKFAGDFPQKTMSMKLEVRSGYITGYGPAEDVKSSGAAENGKNSGAAENVKNSGAAEYD